MILPHPHHHDREIAFLGFPRVDRILHLEESHGELNAEDRTNEQLATYHIDCHGRATR